MLDTFMYFVEGKKRKSFNTSDMSDKESHEDAEM